MKRNLTVTLLFLLVLLLAGILQAGEYVVQKGDTLWSIAGKELKNPDKWQDILKANPNIKDAHWIHAGDKLTIPEMSAATEAAPAAAEVAEPKPVEKPAPAVVAEKPAEKPAPTVTEEKKAVAEVKAEVKAEEKKEAAPAAVETAKEETKADDTAMQSEGAGEVKNEAPPAVSKEVEKEVAAESTQPEKFNVNSATNQISTNVMGSLTLQTDKAPPFETESIPRSKFRAQAKIVGYNPADQDAKTMFGAGDIVVLDVGTNKGLEEGMTVAIYKVGKLMSERGNLDEANRTMEQQDMADKKAMNSVNKIAQAKVITVKKNTCYVEILRSLEPAAIGDPVKFSK